MSPPSRQLLSGEGWNEVMYASADRAGREAVIFFVLVLVLGRFVLLNLFLAVLLDSFAVEGGMAAAPTRDSTSSRDSGNNTPLTPLLSPMSPATPSVVSTTSAPARLQAPPATPRGDAQPAQARDRGSADPPSTLGDAVSAPLPAPEERAVAPPALTLPAAATPVTANGTTAGMAAQ
jgi:hypothetical protein